MERIILVLGGGGVKGVAHAGAWKAILESGYEVAEVVGTSIGALIGASIAGGTSVARLEEQARALVKTDIVDVNRWAVLPNGIRQQAVFRGRALRAYIERVLPVKEWEELAIPLGVNAVDLESGDAVWFGAGGRTDVPLADAVYASAALPVFYPPARLNGMHLVDGGIMDALPITRAADRRATRIIAVHASAGKKKDAGDTVEKGMVAIHHRVVDIMAWARRSVVQDAWFGPPITWVHPDVEDYSTFDFDAVDYFLEEGYRATRSALEELDRELERDPSEPDPVAPA
ncbi:MAG: patatin-like phospholipase family protein [Gemmatimonadetes bacterium]|nr:patatin-like phospholipase family protein [Gemmatimonadota bacterium]